MVSNSARTTSVIAGSRLDLLGTREAARPQLVAPFVLRAISQLG